MAERALLLGIDVGSSRTKALLLDVEGEEAGRATVDTPFRTSGDRTETTADDLITALWRVLEPLGDARSRVAGVGIAGLAESGAPVDREGRALAPIIAWHDRRGEAVAERVAADVGSELARRIGQPLRYVSSVAKLGWLIEQGLTGTARWLGIPELCLYSLTGAQATELSLAARTGCWDVGERTWLPEVAEAAGFTIDVFPEVAAAAEAMGAVSAEAAARSGLPAGTPVTIGGHDHLAGVAGAGAAPADLANSVGTAETVVGRSMTLPDRELALERGAAVTVFPGGEGWAVLASGARAGLAVNAGAEVLGRSPAELDDLAAGATVLGAPGLRESLQQRDPPVLPEGPEGAVWNTLLDALATFTQEAVTVVTGVLGPRPRLVVFGGGASSRPWLAAKARRIEIPVWRSPVGEAVARGAAVFAGVAAGWWPAPADAPAPALEAVSP